MTVLVIAEHDHTSLKAATLNTVTAALACGAEVHVLVAGHSAQAAAKAAAQISGVSKVIHADGPAFAHGLAENVAAQVLALAATYSHFLFPATASGKNIAPRVAALLDAAQISDVTKTKSPALHHAPPGSTRRRPRAARRPSRRSLRWPAAPCRPGSAAKSPATTGPS